MKTPEEMAALFAELPEALANTLRIAEMVRSQDRLPRAPCCPTTRSPRIREPRRVPAPPRRTRAWRGAIRPSPTEIRQRAEYELDVIIKMKFTGYFLIVWDFIDWAKEQGIPVGPGRGSRRGLASSPTPCASPTSTRCKYNLLFERFLNPERISMPDFDIDFCYERRGEVIDYVTRKYGADRTGQIITFGTLKAKAVHQGRGARPRHPLRGREQHRQARARGPEDDPRQGLRGRAQAPGPGRGRRSTRTSSTIAKKLENKNRHTSFHAAGIVIGKTALTDFVPLYKDPKTGIVSTQFTMDYLEKCGLVKMDFLGLKTLTLIKHAHRPRPQARHRDRGGRDPRGRRDGPTSCSARASRPRSSSSSRAGCRRILKQAQAQLHGGPDSAQRALPPRPDGQHPAVHRLEDGHARRSPIPTPASSPSSRRPTASSSTRSRSCRSPSASAATAWARPTSCGARWAKKKHEVMVKEKEKFIEGAVANGFKAADADRIFEILIPFAGYGFNKSHAAAYSVVAYRTAYLKANYPAEFMAANLTNEIANTDKLTEYIGEARSMGLEVLPPDVNRSEAALLRRGREDRLRPPRHQGRGRGPRARDSRRAREGRELRLLHRVRRAAGHPGHEQEDPRVPRQRGLLRSRRTGRTRGASSSWTSSGPWSTPRPRRPRALRPGEPLRRLGRGGIPALRGEPAPRNIPAPRSCGSRRSCSASTFRATRWTSTVPFNLCAAAPEELL